MKRCLLALYLLILCSAALHAQHPWRANEVSIVRDSFGLPHIFGPTDASVAYGLGYAGAEDMFNKLQTLFVAAKGKAGLVGGIPGVAIDYYIQLMRIRERSASRFDSLPPDVRDMLSAYAAGVSAYAAQHPEEHLMPGIFPVEGKDILTAYVVALSSFIGIPDALQNARTRGSGEIPYQFRGKAPKPASNAFAISRNLSAEGQTTLLANPHFELHGPFSWYEAHLASAQGLNTVGAHFPGMPSPGMGSNQRIAWALTFNSPRFVDVYKLSTRKRNKNQYWFDGQWHDFVRSKASLAVRLVPTRTAARLYGDWQTLNQVRSKAPVLRIKKEMLWSVHGPALRTKTGVYAVRANVDAIYHAPEQWYRMARAQNLSEFKAALSIQGIPMFNIVYADADDSLHYQYNAALPRRDYKGAYQFLDGDTSLTLWNHWLKLSEMPSLTNPHCGYIYNTNNPPFYVSGPDCNPSFERYDTLNLGLMDDPVNNRDLRVRELMPQLTRGGKLALNDLLRLKYDVQFPTDTTKGVARVMAAYRRLKLPPGPLADACQQLGAWNLRADSTSTAAALAVLTLRKLGRITKLYSDIFRQGCDCKPEQLTEAAAWAQKWLYATYRRTDVPYSRVLTLYRDSIPYGVWGMPDMLKAMTPTRKAKGRLEVTHGESYIQLVRFTPQGPKVASVVPFGTSERKGSPHFADQLPLYLAEKLKPVETDRKRLEQRAVRIYPPK